MSTDRSGKVFDAREQEVHEYAGESVGHPFRGNQWTLMVRGKDNGIRGKGPYSFLDHLYASPYDSHFGTPSAVQKKLLAHFPNMSPDQAKQVYREWISKTERGRGTQMNPRAHGNWTDAMMGNRWVDAHARDARDKREGYTPFTPDYKK